MVCTSALAIIGIALDLIVIELNSVEPSTTRITIWESELLSLPYIVPSKIVSNNYSMKEWYLENMNRTEWSILTSYSYLPTYYVSIESQTVAL